MQASPYNPLKIIKSTYQSTNCPVTVLQSFPQETNEDQSSPKLSFLKHHQYPESSQETHLNKEKFTPISKVRRAGSTHLEQKDRNEMSSKLQGSTLKVVNRIISHRRETKTGAWVFEVEYKNFSIFGTCKLAMLSQRVMLKEDPGLLAEYLQKLLL